MFGMGEPSIEVKQHLRGDGQVHNIVAAAGAATAAGPILGARLLPARRPPPVEQLC